MSPEVQWNNNVCGETCELSQEVIDACKIIWDRAAKVADPTKFSHISLLDNWIHYRRFYGKKNRPKATMDLKNEVLVAHICRWIINVCELVEDAGEYYSIPIYPENITKRMDFIQIIWDLSLLSILFEWNNPDRWIIPRDDTRSKTNENITAGNCRIFQNGSYSVFDVLYKDVWILDIDKIPHYFLEILSALYTVEDLEIFSSIESFRESWILDGDFWKHILNKCTEFLDQYWWEEGYYLFKAQMIKVKWNSHFILSDCEKKYYNFMTNLRNIHKVFSKDICAVFSYLSSKEFTDFRIASMEVRIKELKSI